MSLGVALGLNFNGGAIGYSILKAIPGSSHAFSLRQLSLEATNVIRVRRSSDNAEQDFSASQINSGGIATFCGAGNGFVTRWYNQVFPTSSFPVRTSARDATNTIAAQQFQIVTSGVQNTENARPCFTGISVGGDSASSRYLVADNITNAGLGDNTLMAVGRRTNTGFTYQSIVQLNSPLQTAPSTPTPGSGSLCVQTLSPGTTIGMHNAWVAATTFVPIALAALGAALPQFFTALRRSGGVNGNGGTLTNRHIDKFPNNLTATGTQTFDSAAGGNLVTIGRQGNIGSVWSHSGPIQEVVIYNRAITDTEIETWATNCTKYYNI
jgi:hypothetical protein